jgi:hypothetical protein
MADSLADMQNTAQGNTLGGITETTGAAPTSIGTAQSLGAAQNAAQMVGTPQQQTAAIKDALSPKSTLAELQRTATGRVEAKKGQSTSALEAVESAKTLTGLAGKIGEATTNAVANAQVPLDLATNIEATIPAGKDANEVKGAFTNLLTALKGGGDPMAAYKKLKELGYNDQSIAQAFNVSPEALWGKVESQLPTNIKVSDMPLEASQQKALASAFPDKTAEELAKMTWQEAKAGMNAYLNNSMTNVADLERQAADKTLPASTRALAVQRLRELGVTGESQAAGQIRELQDIAESKDNVYIDGQAYEVQDVLQSPEAKALITDVLSGAKDISSLKGTPFEGLTNLIVSRSADLEKLLGIKAGQLGAGGKLQELEATRKSNEEGMTSFFKEKGLTPTTDTNVLKALGINDDMINGYSTFDRTVLEKSPTLNAILNLPPERRTTALSVLSRPNAAQLLQSTDTSGLLNLLTDVTNPNGPRILADILNADQFIKDAGPVKAGQEESYVTEFFKSAGLNNVLDLMKQDIDFDIVGQDLPTSLDKDNDGKIDNAADIAKRVQSGELTMQSIQDLKNQWSKVDIGAVTKQKATDDGIIKAYQKPLGVSSLREVLPVTSKLAGIFPTDGSGGYKIVNGMVQLSPSITDFAKITPASIAANPGNVRLNAINFENSLGDSIREIEKVLSTNIKDASPQVRESLTAHYAPMLAALTEARRLNNVRLSAAETALGIAADAAAAKKKEEEEKMYQAWASYSDVVGGNN